MSHDPSSVSQFPIQPVKLWPGWVLWESMRHPGSPVFLLFCEVPYLPHTCYGSHVTYTEIICFQPLFPWSTVLLSPVVVALQWSLGRWNAGNQNFFVFLKLYALISFFHLWWWMYVFICPYSQIRKHLNHSMSIRAQLFQLKAFPGWQRP